MVNPKSMESFNKIMDVIFDAINESDVLLVKDIISSSYEDNTDIIITLEGGQQIQVNYNIM